MAHWDFVGQGIMTQGHCPVGVYLNDTWSWFFWTLRWLARIYNEAMTSTDHPGDPNHPDHEAYLLELGRATYAAAGLAGIAFDVLRIHGGFDSADLYSDPLGTLQGRLKDSLPPLDGIDEFLVLLDEARKVRNDLVHSLPVKHGLHRRTTKDAHYVRNFYTVESLRGAHKLFEKTQRKGNEVLYSDGGEAIRRWYGEG